MRDFNAISGDQREFEFIGVGGPQMIDAGLKPLASIDQFLVNGFLEPLLKLPNFGPCIRNYWMTLTAGRSTCLSDRF